MSVVELTDKKWARGRNGSFVPAQVDVVVYPWEQEVVYVQVLSSRSHGTPPIMLELSPKDAIEVGKALIAEAENKIKEEAEIVRESDHNAEDGPERAPDAGSPAPVQGKDDH